MSRLAQEIISGFAKAMKENDLPEISTVSVGLAIYDGTSEVSFPTLYTNADKALYATKHSGKNNFNFYND